jgi:hypothetical protein
VHVKKFIHSIVQEEMLHMAMACNMLNAIGGKPLLNDPIMLAQFPCPLPGHSKTNNAFTVCLSKCCPDALETFLKIEMPEEVIGHKEHHDGWCTIGEFYDEIKILIEDKLLVDSDFVYGKQVGNKYNPAQGTLYEVHSREDALKALEEIIDQGEGHSGKMYNKDHQLTHFWKFQAIYDLMDNEIWDFQSEVYNMASNPDEKFFPDEAKKINEQFCVTWTLLLNELNAAFNRDIPELDKSIELMFQLTKPAIALMQIPLSGKEGNAGPTFQFIPGLLKAMD